MIKVKNQIAKMATYKPPWTGMDRSGFLRMDLNEHTLSPPDHVKAALKRYIDSNGIQMYPDYGHFLSKVAEYADVDQDQLIVTNGSDQAIEIVLRAFLNADDEMLMAEPGFPMFAQIAGVIGAMVKGIPYRILQSEADLQTLENKIVFPEQAFFQAIGPETKLVIMINPDNPTGVSIPLSTIEAVLKLRADLPVVVDEAYFEFTSGMTTQTSLELLKTYPNLIILRTFSKAFAMAGLRLGYIMARPEIISQFYKIRGPFDVNSCALVAAEAQLDYDNEWRQYVKETMTVSKPWLENFFQENHVDYYPGAAHFMLVKPPNRDEAVDYLKKNNILVRPMIAPSISDTFRMNVGTLEQTQRFARVYTLYIEEG
jgi:histidinol-phosphate aminotransferase